MDTLLAWLLEHGGPVVRYRTAAELLDDPGRVDLDRMRHDLLESPLIKRWLQRLVPGRVHSSRNTAFENAIHKLANLGLKAGRRQALLHELEPKRLPLQAVEKGGAQTVEIPRLDLHSLLAAEK
jgi:hypothetical protein